MQALLGRSEVKDEGQRPQIYLRLRIWDHARYASRVESGRDLSALEYRLKHGRRHHRRNRNALIKASSCEATELHEFQSPSWDSRLWLSSTLTMPCSRPPVTRKKYNSSTSSKRAPVGSCPRHGPRCVPEQRKWAATFSALNHDRQNLHVDIRERSSERLNPAAHRLHLCRHHELRKYLKITAHHHLVDQPAHQHRGVDRLAAASLTRGLRLQ